MKIYGIDKCKSFEEITPEKIGAKREDWIPSAEDVKTVSAIINLNNVDLNDVKTPCMGYASNTLNRPLESNGYLEVIKSYNDKICTQRYTPYGSFPYMRHCLVDGTWTKWESMYTTQNLICGTSELTAGSASLATNYVYQQYE